MTNSFWFILLTFISIGIFAIILYKRRDFNLISLYFFMVGISFLFDYIVLVLLNGYEYYPHIIHNHYFDNVFGSLTSQALAVPVVAVFIAAFRLNLKYILVFILLFVGIEELFLHLGIYKQYWWKTVYTSIFLLFTFLFSQKWYFLTKYSNLILIKFLNNITIVISIKNTLMFFLVLLFHTHHYSLGWFKDATRDHVAGNALYIFLTCIPIAYVVINFNKYSVTILLSLELLLNYVLIHYKLIILADYWHPIYFIILELFSLFLYRYLFKKLNQTNTFYYS